MCTWCGVAVAWRMGAGVCGTIMATGRRMWICWCLGGTQLQQIRERRSLVPEKSLVPRFVAGGLSIDTTYN